MKSYTFTVTESDLRVLVMGLGELPAKMSMHLISKLHDLTIAQETPETSGTPETSETPSSEN